MWDSLSGLTSFRHPALRVSRLFHETTWKRRLEVLLSNVMPWETSRVKCPDQINQGALVAAEWKSYGTMTT